jgi:glycosyltransferase involved in cell wall biosynthesis
VNWKEQCAVVIPCCNEVRRVGEVIRGVMEYVPTVIVVDDGSTDATASAASAAGAEVLRHAPNRGKGAALRTGFERARERGLDWAFTMDGDGQHAPADIPAFLAVAERAGAQLIVGNRLAAAERMPFVRRKVNQLMTWRLSRMTGRPLADSQCGFRLVNLAAWSRVTLRTERFETESEMLVEFVRAGFAVEFVPVQVIYGPGGSKIHPLADTWRWLRWCWRNRA